MDKIKKIQIETIRACNARCRICNYKDAANPQVRRIDEQVFHEVIQQISVLKGVEVVCPYNHNEPLLDRGLFEKIRYIKEMMPDVRIEVSTNGLLLNESNIDTFCGLIDDRWISFHGIDRITYERNMGNLPWENALKIRRLIKERPSTLFVLSIGITPEYRERDVHAFWKGYENVKLMTFVPRSRAGNIRSDAVQYYYNPPRADYDCWRFNLFLMYNTEGRIIPCSNDVAERHVIANHQYSLVEIMRERDRFREMNRCGLRTICWECEDAVVKGGYDGRLAVQGQ